MASAEGQEVSTTKMSAAASSAPRDRTCLDLRCLFAVAVAIAINSLSASAGLWQMSS